MNDFMELENKLVIAQDRLKKAAAALAPKHQGGEWEEFWAAHAEVMKFEREVAFRKGEPHAVSAGFPVKWDTGAPLPHVMMSDYVTLLSFYTRDVDSDWDGTSITVRNPNDEVAQALALVEFSGCVVAKLGDPNDEVFHGHPLYGKGQEPYEAQVVVNSPWIKEIEAMNSVHSLYKPDSWTYLKHYIFWFHDTTFECIAQSFSVELFHEPMSRMLERMCHRLLKL